MNILILGGTAFMGPHVARYLTDWGHKVAVFHRGKTMADLPEQVTEMYGDRSRLPDYKAALASFSPQVVVDMIALNAADAHLLLETFDGMAERTVVASSIDVYRAYGRLTGTEPGEPDLVPLLEDDPLREKPSILGDRYDKIGMEAVVKSRPSLPATILRLPMVYGPGDRQHRLFPYLKRMDDGRETILLESGLADWRISTGYVEDMGMAIALAAKNKKATGRTYNIADSVAFSQRDWVAAIGRAAGWDGHIEVVDRSLMPEKLAPDMDTAQHLFTESSRIRQDLGYTEGVPINEAFARTVAWDRENPPAVIDPNDFDYVAEDQVLQKMTAASSRSRRV